MDLEIYRATTLAEALDYTEHIRIVHDDERWRTYCGKTGNCIYWFLEKAGNAGSTPAKIAKVIGKSRQAVKKYLWRLHSDGLVEKIGRGVYRNFPKEAE